jgi:two-component SAPR family response regulator
MEKIRQNEPDIIILDIKMPGTDGIEFMRKLKEEKGDIPVVLCSAYGGFKNDFRVWASDAYVIKSANLTELKTIVNQILDHKRSD